MLKVHKARRHLKIQEIISFNTALLYNDQVAWDVVITRPFAAYCQCAI
jgi:hypothetical protein